MILPSSLFFFFQAEDGIRDRNVNGVQTCALPIFAGPGQGAVHKDSIKHLHDKDQGTGKKEEIGEVLYNRGLVSAMMTVEAVKQAQGNFGNRPLKGEEVRWGLETLSIDAATIKKLGFEGYMTPVKTSCSDHEGARIAAVQAWDGKNWKRTSGVYEADMKILGPMIKASAEKYASEKKLTKQECAQG